MLEMSMSTGNARPRVLDIKYTGTTAETYEARRKGTQVWADEQKIVYHMLSTAVNAGARSVMDVPVGTGRFLGHYQALKLNVIGYDISDAMLEQTRFAAEQVGLNPNMTKLQVADIRNLGDPDAAVDIVLCVRFMQHVDFDECKAVLHELTRVSSRYIVLGVHMLGDTVGTYMSPLLHSAQHPVRTVNRFYSASQRRLKQIRKTREEEGRQVSGDSYMAAADNKPYSAVLEEFKKNNLLVCQEHLITTGLNPFTPRIYKMFLLEKE